MLIFKQDIYNYSGITDEDGVTSVTAFGADGAELKRVEGASEQVCMDLLDAWYDRLPNRVEVAADVAANVRRHLARSRKRPDRRSQAPRRTAYKPRKATLASTRGFDALLALRDALPPNAEAARYAAYVTHAVR